MVDIVPNEMTRLDANGVGIEALSEGGKLRRPLGHERTPHRRQTKFVLSPSLILWQTGIYLLTPPPHSLTFSLISFCLSFYLPCLTIILGLIPSFTTIWLISLHLKLRRLLNYFVKVH